MKLIVGGMATGKTHRLILEALKDDHAAIICATVLELHHMREAVTKVARAEGKDIREAVSKVWHVKDPRIPFGSNLYIDDLQWTLLRVLGKPVRMATENCAIETPQGRAVTWDYHNPYTNSQGG